MKKNRSKIGKIIATIIVGLVIISNIIGINVSDLDFLSGFRISLFIPLLIAFFVMVYFHKTRNNFLIIFFLILFMLFTQAIIITKSINFVEIQNIDSSMTDRNAAIGVSWILILPFVVIVMLLIGIFYDYLRNKSLGLSKNQ